MKKLLTVLLAAVMLFAAIPVMAFAESVEDTAVAVESGTKQTATLKEKHDSVVYKVKLTSDGDLEIALTAKLSRATLTVLDSDGNAVGNSSYDMKSGAYDWVSSDRNVMELKWNESVEKIVGTFTYALKKGTYYISVSRGNKYYDASGKGNIAVTAKFPGEEKEETAKISVLGITMKKGDTIQLTADLTSGDGKVTWKSSKKTVAKVSEDGVVTAVKKGTATITAKCGKSTLKLKITVK